MCRNIIILNLAFIGLFIINSCGTDEKKFSDVNLHDSINKIQYPVNGKISFSGYEWFVNSTKNVADSRTFCLTNENNVWVDENGRLNLVISKIDGIWYGAELISDTIFGFGEYIFYCDSYLDSIDRNASLSLIGLNIKDITNNGITQMGIRFSYWGEEDNPNPLEYFVYASDKKVAETSTLPKPYVQQDSNSTHLFSIRENSFGYSTFNKHELNNNNLLGEVYISKEHRSSFDFDITYSNTSNSNKVLINYCLSESNEPFNNQYLHLIISRFEFVPVDYNGIARY